MKRIQAMMFAGVVAVAGSAYAHGGHEHGVSFEMPKDGATVSQTFKIKMEVKGMQVHKAGDIVEGRGHHHLIIDGACVNKGEVIAKDATHKHFGKGQTETELKLTPGAHTLSLQFANGHHESYGKDWCKTIHVTVQ